jgi:cold shock CspA family protein
MQIPPQITFRGFERSESVEANILERVAKLEEFFPRIVSCRVVVQAQHRHHHQGKLYHLCIDLKVPDKELVVSRSQHDKQAHEDIYVAIRDAFDAATRKLEEHARVKRRKIKSHEVPPHGKVSDLIPDEDYGFISTSTGRQIYFHRNSVTADAFDTLTLGTEVRFVEVEGDEGPQASTVQPVGKHHIVG